MTIPLPIFAPGKLYRRLGATRYFKCLGNVDHLAVMQQVYGRDAAGTDSHFMDKGGEPFLLSRRSSAAKDYREVEL